MWVSIFLGWQKIIFSMIKELCNCTEYRFTIDSFGEKNSVPIVQNLFNEKYENRRLISLPRQSITIWRKKVIYANCLSSWYKPIKSNDNRIYCFLLNNLLIAQVERIVLYIFEAATFCLGVIVS